MADKLDEFHCHEVLHTIHVVRNLVEKELVEHPFTQAHPKVAKALQEAISALGRAYQRTGAIEFAEDALTAATDSQGQSARP